MFAVMASQGFAIHSLRTSSEATCFDLILAKPETENTTVGADGT